jgi:hypothetical protein
VHPRREIGLAGLFLEKRRRVPRILRGYLGVPFFIIAVNLHIIAVSRVEMSYFLVN